MLAGVDGCNSVNYVGKAEPRQLKNLEKEKSINKSWLATKHYPQTKKQADKKSTYFFGRGRWIRTNEVTESESVALPLGDTPI